MNFIKLVSIPKPNQLSAVVTLQYRSCYSMKKSEANPFRKKSKLKKPKINKDHPVIKYINEIQALKPELPKTSILEEDASKLLHTIETSSSQVLGFDLAEFKTRIQLFHGLGSTLSDSITLALSIPSIFHVNNTNLRSIVKVLRQYNLSVEKIIIQYPYIGAIGKNTVESNLKLLTELVPVDELNDFILNYPTMLVFKLEKTSIEKLIQSSLHSDDNISKLHNIVAAMENPAVENLELNKLLSNKEKFEDSIEEDMNDLLESYNIDKQFMYKKCPQFLITPVMIVEKCIELISGTPFYFEEEDVEKLLKTHPDIILLFNDNSTLEMVNYLEGIFNQKGHLFRLLNEEPEMLRDSETVLHRIQLFKKFGFEDNDIALILSQAGGANFFMDCLEFTETAMENILQFYFKENDLVPSQIVFSALACLSPKFEHIVRERISYLRHIGKMNIIAKKRKRKRTQLTILTIVKSDLENFIKTICGTTQEHYDDFLKDYIP